MKALTIMPNFTITAEVNNDHYMDNLFGPLQCYCEVEANVEYVDSYKITRESIWDGMNIAPKINFIQLLKDNTDKIPANVLTVIEKFVSRFGLIIKVGDDCLKVKSNDLLTEIKHNTRLNEMIYEYDGDLIFFAGDINLFQNILHKDLECPIKFRKSKMITFYFDDGTSTEIVKAVDYMQAFKSLYGDHLILNENRLRQVLNHKKDKITDETIEEFINVVMKNINDHFVRVMKIIK